ncbi:MAG: hypothetical protein KF800_02685 [Lysobacter sp.]|nr:hypothetical protein [Lysobacter sp.]
MSRIHALTLSVAALIAPGVSTAAELTPGLPPEAVLREAYARMRAGDWDAAAEAFDPAALARFRAMLEPLFSAASAPAGEGQENRDAMMLMLLFAPAKSVEEVRALSDRALFARLMRGTMSLAGAELDEQAILGSVAEGKDRVHVVTRNTARMDRATVSRVEAVTLQRTAQGWRLALTGEIEGLAETLQATVEAGRTESGEDLPSPPTP